jgi:putative nucleotidyltransferase with HDIG domain
VAVPDRERAEALLRSYQLPDGIVRHSEGVARVAAEAARLVVAAGITLDVGLVEAAALLHDIDKQHVRTSGEEHGIVAARWLSELGYEELAVPVASHPIACLLDDERFPIGWPSVIVSVADRHVAQVYLGTDARIDDMAERYPEYRDELNAARRPAHALERELAEVTGLDIAGLDARLRAAWEAGT